MKKTFCISKKSSAKRSESQTGNSNHETLFLNIRKQDNMPYESIDIYRSAASVFHLLKPCFIGHKDPSKSYFVNLVDDMCISITFATDDLERLTGCSCIDDIFNDMKERLERLRECCEQPTSRFRHADWLAQQPVQGIERTARAFKIAGALQRHRCELSFHDMPLTLPDVRFQTTRSLPEERRSFGRPVGLKLDQKAGQIEIPLDQKKTRNIQFRCLDSSVFSKIVNSLQQGTFLFRPVIDLISSEQDQLHSIEILDMSSCQMNGNLDFQESMQ